MEGCWEYVMIRLRSKNVVSCDNALFYAPIASLRRVLKIVPDAADERHQLSGPADPG
jgi:hypothetical protein